MLLPIRWPALIVMSGVIGETGFFMASPGSRKKMSGQGRGAQQIHGYPVVLADGETWQLAYPRISCSAGTLTEPDLDREIDRIYESMILSEQVDLTDIWCVARKLLRENYELNDCELTELLRLEPGEHASVLVNAVLTVLFGDRSRELNYLDWVRATLLSSGLASSQISFEFLHIVLSVLVATNRVVSSNSVVRANQVAQERSNLESLI